MDKLTPSPDPDHIDRRTLIDATTAIRQTVRNNTKAMTVDHEATPSSQDTWFVAVDTDGNRFRVDVSPYVPEPAEYSESAIITGPRLAVLSEPSTSTVIEGDPGARIEINDALKPNLRTILALHSVTFDDSRCVEVVGVPFGQYGVTGAPQTVFTPEHPLWNSITIQRPFGL